MTLQQQVPVGIHGSNINRASGHCIEQRAHRAEVTDDVRIQCPPVLGAISQKMVTQGVEGGMGVLRRPRESTAERVRKRLKATIGLYDQVGAIECTALRPWS